MVFEMRLKKSHYLPFFQSIYFNTFVVEIIQSSTDLIGISNFQKNILTIRSSIVKHFPIQALLIDTLINNYPLAMRCNQKLVEKGK